MRLPPYLSRSPRDQPIKEVTPRRTLAALVIGLLLTLLVVPAAHAAKHGPDGSLCRMDTARVELPADFFLRVCFDGSTLVFANDSELLVRIKTDPQTVGTVSPGPGADVPSSLASFLPREGNFIPPKMVLRLPVGTGKLKITIDGAGEEASKAYATARLVPSLSGRYSLAQELVTVSNNLRTCLDSSGWAGDIGCRAGWLGNVTFALGRAGIAATKGSVSALMTLVESAKWTDLASSQANLLHRSTTTFTVRAVSTAQAPSTTCAYKDAGNGERITAPKGSTFTDSRGISYRVGNDCSLTRTEAATQTCAYNDAGNGERITAPKGSTFTDSRGISYRVGNDCNLTEI